MLGEYHEQKNRYMLIGYSDANKDAANGDKSCFFVVFAIEYSNLKM